MRGRNDQLRRRLSNRNRSRARAPPCPFSGPPRIHSLPRQPHPQHPDPPTFARPAAVAGPRCQCLFSFPKHLLALPASQSYGENRPCRRGGNNTGWFDFTVVLTPGVLVIVMAIPSECDLVHLAWRLSIFRPPPSASHSGSIGPSNHATLSSKSDGVRFALNNPAINRFLCPARPYFPEWGDDSVPFPSYWSRNTPQPWAFVFPVNAGPMGIHPVDIAKLAKILVFTAGELRWETSCRGLIFATMLPSPMTTAPPLVEGKTKNFGVSS